MAPHVRRRRVARQPLIGRVGACVLGAVLGVFLCAGAKLLGEALHPPVPVVDLTAAVDAARDACVDDMTHIMGACVAVRGAPVPLPVAAVPRAPARP